MGNGKRVRFGLMAVISSLALGASLVVSDRVAFAESDHGLDRPGFYVGAGGLFAIPDFDLNEFEAKAANKPHLPSSDITQDEAWGFDARGGYRLGRNFAAELDFQYLHRFDLDLKGFGRVAEAEMGTITLNLKPYLVPDTAPFNGRAQVYGLLGLGLAIAEIDASKTALGFGRDEVEFLAKFGIGTDIYLTRNVFAFTEYTYNLPTESLVDFRYSAIAFGIGLRLDSAPEPPPAPPPPPVAAAPAPASPPVKRKIVLRSVQFDFDKATIRPDAVPVLNEAVDTLKQEGDVAVVVEGHTDSMGSDSYNEGLSRRRAQAVHDYLVDHGISASRLSTEAYGESKPVATNDTEDGRAQNRRVELRVEN